MSAGLLTPWAGLLDAAGGPTLWCRDVRRAARSVGAVDTGVATCARTPGPPALVTRPLLGDALDECTGGLRAPTRAQDAPPDPLHDAPPRPGARPAAVARPRGGADVGRDGGRDDDAHDPGPSTACRPRGPERTAAPTPPPRAPTARGAVSRVLHDLCPPAERPTAPRPAPTPVAPRPPVPRPPAPAQAAPPPPAARAQAPTPTAVPSVRTGPRSAPLPAVDCGEDLAARAARRVARRIGATDLSGLAAHRAPPAADGERALRGVLDRLAHGADVARAVEAVAAPSGQTTERPLDLGATDPRAPVPRRRGDDVVTDGAGGRPGTVPGRAPASRGPRRDRDGRRDHDRRRADGGDSVDLGRRDGPRRGAGDVGLGAGTDPVLRAPDRAHDASDPDGRPGRRDHGRAGAPGLPELPDRPGRLVALGGTGLDDSPHDGSTTGPAPTVLAGTLGTPPQPTAWDSSGVSGVGGSLPAVSAPVLERLLERVLDDAARRHGIEV